MLKKRTAIAAALCLAMTCAHAGFVDNRSAAAGGEIEVAFKSITVADLLTEIVPPEYTVLYGTPEQGMRRVTVIGKGVWQHLLTRAQTADMKFHIDPQAKVVRVAAPGEVIAPSASRPVAPKAAALPVFRTTSTDYQVSTVLSRWVEQAQMQLVWEPRDVDYPVQAENEWGTDFRVALQGLLGSVQGGRALLRACIHPNNPRNVVRIIKYTERCKGEWQ